MRTSWLRELDLVGTGQLPSGRLDAPMSLGPDEARGEPHESPAHVPPRHMPQHCFRSERAPRCLGGCAQIGEPVAHDNLERVGIHVHGDDDLLLPRLMRPLVSAYPPSPPSSARAAWLSIW